MYFLTFLNEPGDGRFIEPIYTVNIYHIILSLSLKCYIDAEITDEFRITIKIINIILLRLYSCVKTPCTSVHCSFVGYFATL